MTAGSVEQHAEGQVEGYVAGRVAFSAVDGPGNRWVVFLQGCGYDCLACHNPCSIPVRPRGMTPTPVTEVAAAIRDAAPFLTGVTVSGGEATLQAGFVRALFEDLAGDRSTAHLTRFVDSNGDCDPDVWELLAPVTDGVMLDLKALDDETHVVLTGASNARSLASIVDVAARGLLHEVRLLVVPALNDSPAAIDATGAWLARVDAGMRVRVLGFRHAGTRACARDLLEPTAEELAAIRSRLVAAGLTDVS